ncbi:saccharopine dehydrogenase NADP-binding domain-containing protein [Pseudofrankia sp. DC12]|uniref:saccharopine dehydrogenase family protein n=1 Tax=Pseudofrankia sp. DC12 TaxID=683315 RepID=UPI0005F7A992|nr:saccharopine dehydrogenase NADP-binding domain-containing protein [Pseudofrankia sp. DC12]
MGGRIVVFGATGYTGRLVTAELVAAGHRPVVAGRDRARVDALRARHGDLPGALADAADADSVRRLVGPGDVLVATVGPFSRFGRPAVDAAIVAGAHYLDSSGEADFLRQVYDDAGPRAECAGVVLLPASGFDCVPGNLAGALALRDAGEEARRVYVAYQVVPPGGRLHRLGVSSGTRATMLASALSPVEALRAGRLVTLPYGREVRAFQQDRSVLTGVLWAGTEARTLPRLAPRLTEVATYMVTGGVPARLARAASYPLATLSRLRAFTRLAGLATAPALRVTGRGPDPAAQAATSTVVLAAVADATGRQLATVRLQGVDPYVFTGRIMAWIAGQLASGAAAGHGALGPVEAFGVDELEHAVAAAGLRRAGLPGASSGSS